MTTATVQRVPTVTDALRSSLALTVNDVADIGTLRHRLTEALAATGCAEDLVDIAGLLSTELLSNALRHADTGGGPRSARLDAYCHRRCVIIAVSDSDPLLPVCGTAGPDAEGGRGLALLEALSIRWGARPTATGKTVWCLIA